MDLILSMLITFCILIFSISKGMFVGYPLMLCFLVFALVAWRRGFLLKDIVEMSFSGGKKAFVVLKIFVLIGAITGIWMAAGTVPGIVYYGMKYMNPKYFILYAFIISSLVSFLLGTSFGTVSTVGVALIVMAKSGNVNVDIAAGAMIAGAYFGDRCSPMSSSANLIVNLTETNLYANMRNMFKTSIIPFLLCMVLYFMFSLKQPLHFTGNRIDMQIASMFKISWIVLLPAAIILVLSVFRVNVKVSMSISIATASAIALVVQKYSLAEVFRFILLGFNLDDTSPLQSILKGGGVISMWKPALVVFISCSLAGLFDETNMLQSIEKILMKSRTRCHLFIHTILVSIFTAAFGCNQAISIVLTDQLMKKSYESKGISNYDLATDLENTAVVLAAILPWNIAAFVPTVTMKVSSTGFIPYAFYLYLIPVFNVLHLKALDMLKKKRLKDAAAKEM